MSGFIEFLKFAIPSIGLVCLDWWSYEIIMLLAAGISVKCSAIQVIVLNNGNIFYMPPAAIMVSSEILIGNCIGAQNIREGKHLTKIFIYLGIGTSIFLAFILFFFSDVLASFYTNIPDLEAAVSLCFRYYAFFQLCDGLRGVMTGAMRGLGLLKESIIIVFVASYVIAPPLQYLFGYTLGFEVNGLWAGMLIGTIVVTAWMAFILYVQRDWAMVAREAHERME
jgi:multidrug resistance protein, MATE family